jgi:hypothetical protein
VLKGKPLNYHQVSQDKFGDFESISSQSTSFVRSGCVKFVQSSPRLNTSTVVLGKTIDVINTSGSMQKCLYLFVFVAQFPLLEKSFRALKKFGFASS